MAGSLEEGDFEFIFNNVIFPPQLPQSGDADEWKHEDALISLALSVTRIFLENDSEEARPTWHSVADMLENLKAIGKQDLISEIDLVQVLENLNGSRGHDVLHTRSKLWLAHAK
ncbi:hypothetical protein DIZ76_016421 [Coccidioides immitis]|nr:hypothetical protein DIZ76_016421 [Coccidioides immitis]